MKSKIISSKQTVGEDNIEFFIQNYLDSLELEINKKYLETQEKAQKIYELQQEFYSKKNSFQYRLLEEKEKRNLARVNSSPSSVLLAQKPERDAAEEVARSLRELNMLDYGMKRRRMEESRRRCGRVELPGEVNCSPFVMAMAGKGD